MAVKPAPKTNEYDRLANFRFEALVELGLSADDAISLMHTLDIVHTAQKLKDQGCPLDLIVYLLED